MQSHILSRIPFRSAATRPLVTALGTGPQRVPFQSPQAGQQRIKREVFNGAWAANTVLTVQMPRNYDIETIYVTITGTVNYPAALVAAVVRNDAPYGLFNRVELIAEGRQTLFSVPGYVLGMSNIRRHKRATYRERFETFQAAQQYPLVYTSPTTTMPVSTSVPFSGMIAIDLQNIAGVRPKDTNLRSGGLQTLDLKLTLSDLTSLFYPAAATATPFAAPTIGALPVLTGYTLTPTAIIVAVAELQEMQNAKSQISTPTFVQRWSHADYNLPAVQNDFPMLLPTDNFIGAVFATTKQSGESVNGLISRLKLARGVDVRYNWTATMLQAIGQEDYDWSLPAGHYIADLMGAGAPSIKISDAWNAQGGADTRAFADVLVGNAFTNLGLTVVEYLPLRAA